MSILLFLSTRYSIMTAQGGLHVSVSARDFKFVIDADRATVKDILIAGTVATVSLAAAYGIFKYVFSKKPDFDGSVKKGFGGDRDDQNMGGIETGSLHVVLHCLTNERFLEVLEEYKSGKIKERLEKELLNIGIATEGLVVQIENIEEVEKKAEAIKTTLRYISPQIIVNGNGAYFQPVWRGVKDDDVYVDLVKESAKKGYDILKDGGTAVDAVEAAVRFMEENEFLNAGYGSILTCDGEVECDAMIMDGNTLNCGSVTSGRHFRNPVSLARLIMEKLYHCALSGEGALKFAEEKGFPVTYNMDELITQRARKEIISYEEFVKNVDCRMRGLLVRETDEDKGGDPSSAVAAGNSNDTVSAVARDAKGHFACAVSTGGVAGKRKGRVSDAAMVGCGGYANEHGAATTSGLGESLIKMTLAREVVYKMESERNAKDSAKESLNKLRTRVGDVGGVIAIDKHGNFGREFTAKSMPWASIKENTLEFGSKKGEVKKEEL